MRRSIKSLIAAQQRPDTPEELADRLWLNGILEQVKTELRQRYPVITATNGPEALEWQQERIRELRGGR